VTANAEVAARTAAVAARGRVLSSAPVSRLRSLLANLFLVLVSLAVCAAIAETAARIYAASLARPDPAAAAVAKPISRFHPTLGWDKPPGGEARIRRAEFDIEIRINSLGLRGPEYGYAKPAGTKRVLILGDSFAEGYYVDEPDTARAVLEKDLNAGPCRGWQVVNGGTIAYSTDQEYLFFREEGYRYQPDLVTLLFYHNDLLYNASGRGPGGEVKPFFGVDDGQLVARHTTLAPDPEGAPNRQNPGRAPLRPWRGSIALRLLSNRTVNASPRLHEALAGLGLVQPVSDDPPREFWPYGPGRGREVGEMWAVTAALLRALKQDVEARGARLSVLYVPARFEVNASVWQTTRERYQLGKRWDPYVVYDRLQKEMDAIGVPLLDTREALSRTEASGPPAYYTRDVHWNAVGNRIAAEALQRHVEADPVCRPGSPP
jgi:SGNH hydrolase-like domain, acetyltransferase AlgX